MGFIFWAFPIVFGAAGIYGHVRATREIQERRKQDARKRLDHTILIATQFPNYIGFTEMHNVLGDLNLDNDYRQQRWDDFWKAFSGIVEQRKSIAN